jgi:hypothetical protein
MVETALLEKMAKMAYLLYLVQTAQPESMG